MRRPWNPDFKPKRSDRMATVLLLPQDEAALQAAIVAAWPSTRIIDGRAPWPAQTTSRPPVRDSVLDVERNAFLWDPEIHPRLPTPRFTGYARRAPQAGRVVEWRRSLCTDGVLASGMISAVVWDDMDPRMIAFISAVWRAVVEHTSNNLVRWIEGTGQEQLMRASRVGHHALAAARAGEICLGTTEEKWRLHPPSQEKARGAHW
ncbi:hypothetical protein UK23_13865 [Lentzea aerocolonigenes]|uniref:Uncharacterized protein n=1 Tax=Lentzea aerocolonigenes TaxID=68170 RepID=A0A0F0H1B7_LENAE|nr:hypothetical protein [Lentzea aerocolonigenes]KJK49385.1 hypothetical protein UK23_13865 [Lentzea aerocolonigenes]